MVGVGCGWGSLWLELVVGWGWLWLGLVVGWSWWLEVVGVGCWGWWLELVVGVGGWDWLLGLVVGVGGWGWWLELVVGIGCWGWLLVLVVGVGCWCCWCCWCCWMLVLLVLVLLDVGVVGCWCCWLLVVVGCCCCCLWFVFCCLLVVVCCLSLNPKSQTVASCIQKTLNIVFEPLPANGMTATGRKLQKTASSTRSKTSFVQSTEQNTHTQPRHRPLLCLAQREKCFPPFRPGHGRLQVEGIRGHR